MLRTRLAVGLVLNKVRHDFHGDVVIHDPKQYSSFVNGGLRPSVVLLSGRPVAGAAIPLRLQCEGGPGIQPGPD
jgi:hypothetical protein